MYDAYQAQLDLLAPYRAAADLTRSALASPMAGPAANYWLTALAAGAEIFSRAHLIHERPPFGITEVMVGTELRPVTETVVLDLPFARLLHFAKETKVPQPKLLLAAPMAGHFPTLLRHTVQTLLADHDVYVTDWKNARDVATNHGRFGTDDYIEYLMTFLRRIGPGVHAMAVCQPCPALLAATALLSEDKDDAAPRSLTLMAGPVDTSINPTEVNLLAKAHSRAWFEENLITVVPRRYDGAGRHVYPGFIQLSAFMTMNLPRHVRAHMDLYSHILRGEVKKADANRKFYDEYFAVSDLPAEFYLETLVKIFQEHHLPRGIYEYRGRRVDPGAIRRTALLTVEGEKDDICSIGQTLAAHDLTRAIKPFRKKHYVQAGVGHYGVFSGTRWATQIYPMVRSTIQQAD